MATTYSLTPSTRTVTEGNVSITFTVTRSGDTPAETIYASTLFDTASSSSGDYDALVNRAVTFSAGQTSTTFTVGVNEDSVVEGTEHFRVMLGRTTSTGSSGALDISDVYIEDDDAAAPATYSLTPGTVTRTEGNTTITFTVSRSGGTLGAETIYASTLFDTATSSSGDYDPLVNVPVVFSSGETSETFTVSINEDSIVEATEHFRVMIGATTSAGSSSALDISDVYIEDDDTAQPVTYSLTPASVTRTEGETTITFTVTRSGGTLGAETIYASTLFDTATSSSGDYDPLVNVPVVFSSGETSETFTVSINEDSVVEATEHFRVMIGATTSAGSAQALDISDVYIEDNDGQATAWSLTPGSVTQTENDTGITFTVTRSGSNLQAATIYASTLLDTATSAGGDYDPLVNSPISFTAGETTKTFTVGINEDSIVEATEHFRVMIGASTSAGSAEALDISDVFIEDDDGGTSGTTYSASAAPTSITEGGQITFTITRSGNLPSETLFVSTTQTEGFTNSKDYTGLNSQALAFTSGQTSATITVATTNDTAPEIRETFGLIVQRDGSSPASVYLAKTTFSIDDNDSSQQPLYSVVANPAPVAENGGSVTFTITRTGSLGAETLYASTLNGSASGYATNNGDYATTANNLPVVFATGQASKTVTVAILDDAIAETDETFGFIVQRNSTDTASTYLAKTNWTISNDDGVASSSYSVSPATRSVGESAGSLAFTITRTVTSSAESLYVSTTQDAGARNEGDYSTNINNFPVSFAAGQSSRTVVVGVTNDTRPEQNETFGVIVQKSAADPVSTFVARTDWTIEDDDVGSVTRYGITTATPVVTNQAGTQVVFQVTRSGDLPGEAVYAATRAISGTSPSEVFVGPSTTPINFEPGATTSGPIIITLAGAVLRSFADFAFGIFASGASVAHAETNFSVRPDSSYVPPVLQLPFAADAGTNGLVHIYQGFGDGARDPINNDHGRMTNENGYLYYSVDYGLFIGTTVLSQGIGTVVDSRADSSALNGEHGGYGNFVTVHYYLQGRYDFYATYLHLGAANVLTPNSKVSPGDIIGYSGDSGAGGVHLHVTYGRTSFLTGRGFEMANGSLNANPPGGPVVFYSQVDGDPNTPDSAVVGNNVKGDNDGRTLILDTTTPQVANGTSTGGTVTVSGSSKVASIVVSAAKSALEIVESVTSKVVATVEHYGELAIRSIRNVVIQNLSGSSIFAHTIHYDGTTEDNVLDASDTQTSIIAHTGAGNDTVVGGLGDDWLDGGAGDDRLDGGAGHDRASYATSAAAVYVTLALLGSEQNTSGAGIDTLVDIEGVIGTAFPDTLIGNGSDNFLDGLGGADILRGGAGDDIYVIDNAGDVVSDEQYGQGMDTVYTTLAVYSLFGTFIERLAAASDVAHDFRGSGGHDVISGGAGNDLIRLSDGGADHAIGGGGNDVLYFGAAFTGGDIADGSDGRDVLILQGNYALTLSATNLVGIESISLQSGARTTWGDTANNFYDYAITTNDANVTAGQQLIVNGQSLRAGEDFTFNGSAETDGTFLVYGGHGVDTFKGGAGNDVFFFEGARFQAGDKVDGGAGRDALIISAGNGLSRFEFGASSLTGIESISLNARYATDPTARPSYELILHNGNVAPGATLIINGSSLTDRNQSASVDGSAEQDGSLILLGGFGNDVLIGGAGADRLQGGEGIDVLTGGGGADTFRYASQYDATPQLPDRILDFVSGTDRIDLGAIDADVFAAGNQAFRWIGSSAFAGTGAASAGELRAYQFGNDWFVEGDMDGNGAADLVIQLTAPVAPPVQGDFLL